LSPSRRQATQAKTKPWLPDASLWSIARHFSRSCTS